MTAAEYLAALDDKLADIAGLVAASSIQRELNSNIGIGWLKGQITFVDDSRFEFTEQLPTERRKFRLHYMDSANHLIVRWDSAPHHKQLQTFPFHKHTPQTIETHEAITVLQALDQIIQMLKV